MKDLIENKKLRREFSADKELSVDEFADKHMSAIRAYYKSGGYEVTEDAAHQLACKVWRSLREPMP